MRRRVPFFHLFRQGPFHENPAPPDPLLFAGGRNRPAQLPAGSDADASIAGWVDPAVVRESDGSGGSNLQQVVRDSELDCSGCPNNGGSSANKDRAAARSFLR